MNEYAVRLWLRAREAWATAERDLPFDQNATANRAYYAAFYAVSALFALDGKEFSKHSALEAAVHRELVRTGRWSADLGRDYQALRRMRATGDYSVLENISAEEASAAVGAARRILEGVRQAQPELEHHARQREE